MTDYSHVPHYDVRIKLLEVCQRLDAVRTQQTKAREEVEGTAELDKRRMELLAQRREIDNALQDIETEIRQRRRASKDAAEAAAMAYEPEIDRISEEIGEILDPLDLEAYDWFDEDVPVRCAVSGLILFTTDYVLHTEDDARYVLADAIGITRESVDQEAA